MIFMRSSLGEPKPVFKRSSKLKPVAIHSPDRVLGIKSALLSRNQENFVANVSEQNSQQIGLPFFGALDGFRGLLATFVAIYHTYWFSHINSSPFLDNGPIIIDLFFVFSGFLLFTLYGNRIKTPDQGLRFIKKRFARLYPLHLFVVCLFMIFVSFRVIAHAIGFADLEPGEILPFQSGARESISTLLSNLTLTQAMGVHDSTSFNVPSWTISVEFYAYFLFAAVLIWAPIRKFWHFGVLTLIVCGLYWILSRLKPDMNITYDYAFLRCLAGFYTGVVVAGLYAWIKKEGWDKKVGFGISSVLEVFVVTGSTLFVIYCPGRLQFFVGPVLFAFVLIFSFDKGIVSRFMMLPVFRYLAKISYSVYMVHMIIAVFFYAFATVVLSRILGPDWFNSGLYGDLFLVPYLATVFAASHLTQKYVEVPAQKYLMGKSILPKWLVGKFGVPATAKP